MGDDIPTPRLLDSPTVNALYPLEEGQWSESPAWNAVRGTLSAAVPPGNGLAKLWHLCWTCPGNSHLILYQVSRAFPSHGAALKSAFFAVDHTSERLGEQFVQRLNMRPAQGVTHIARPVLFAERGWAIGAQFHQFCSQEFDTQYALPYLESLMKSEAMGFKGLTLLHLNTFFVDGCFLHKIYTMCEVESWRDADKATQRIAMWLTGHKQSVVSLPLVLCPALVQFADAKRNWEQVERRVLESSAALPAGQALDDVVCNEVSALRELLLVLSRGLPPSAGHGLRTLFAKMLAWPLDKRFPAMDLLGALALSRDGAPIVQPHVARVVEQLTEAGSNVSATVFSLRLLCNCARWAVCNGELIARRDAIIDALPGLLASAADARVRAAAVCVMLNFANMLQYCDTEQPARERLRAIAVELARRRCDVSDRAVQVLCLLALHDGDTTTAEVLRELRDDANPVIATCASEMLKFSSKAT